MRGAARACSPCHGNLIQYSMEDGATQTLNMGEKKKLVKRLDVLNSLLTTCYRIMPGIHIDSEWSMQSSSLGAPRGETELDAWIHDSLQNESEKNTRAQEDHGEITGELWWISELNSIINHSRKKNNHIANKLNNNCISFPHQKTQSVQPWTD